MTAEIIPLIPDPIFDLDRDVWIHRCRRCHGDYKASHMDMSPLPANVCPTCMTEGEIDSNDVTVVLKS